MKAIGLLLLLFAACAPNFSDINSKTFCRQDSDCLAGRVCVMEIEECWDPAGLGQPGVSLDTGRTEPNPGWTPRDSGFDAPRDAGAGPNPLPDVPTSTDTGTGGPISVPVDTGASDPPPDESVEEAVPGDVVITEVMIDPGGINQILDEHGEWVEVMNITGRRLSMDTWSLWDGGSRSPYRFPAGEVLEPLQRIVVGRSPDLELNGGVRLDYVLDGQQLANSEDWIQLKVGNRLLDEVRWFRGTGWPVFKGVTMSLDPHKHTPAGNDLPGNWCASYIAIRPGGDRGTPGTANPPCPDRPPNNCDDPIDVSAGGVFGWDLTWADNFLTDLAYFGQCDIGGVTVPAVGYGANAPNVAFKVRPAQRRRWSFELQALREDADLVLYVWKDFCVLLGEGVGCVDQTPGAGADQPRTARWEATLDPGVTYFVIVDGKDSTTANPDTQPFTLEVVPGAPE